MLTMTAVILPAGKSIAAYNDTCRDVGAHHDNGVNGEDIMIMIMTSTLAVLKMLTMVCCSSAEIHKGFWHPAVLAVIQPRIAAL